MHTKYVALKGKTAAGKSGSCLAIIEQVTEIILSRIGVYLEYFINVLLILHIPLELHADSDCICMTVSDGTACLSDLNCIYF